MNISYNWLKNYLDFDLSPDQTAAALTSIGLETKGAEEVQPVKGGLEGLTIGEVLACVEHPNSDHLHVTTVTTGEGEPLQIVCGAPNVATGQKVVVALCGAKLYSGEECLTIKRSKIRGVESNGMICAEDEIGIGNDHSGIIVLPDDAVVGMPAKEYYNIKSDFVLEVDITPNRVDATSHFGVARDLAAYLRQNGERYALKRPSVEDFRIDSPQEKGISVEVPDSEPCPRYTGLTIRGVKVVESPQWLQDALKTIGLRPINNVVDVTNYVLHETGQPLHAFDISRIKGGKVVVRTAVEGEKFVTLDGVERTLTAKDLMICNAEAPMCIGGVFGGLDSGVTEGTTDVFLESATFNPTWIRKTARRFGLNTDASFRYERGLDPNQTVYALKRAALLIRELAGGTFCGSIEDVYPSPVSAYNIDVEYEKIYGLTGKVIPKEVIRSILDSLEIVIVSETESALNVNVPVYRFDVRRDVDIIEEILRIYGYNNVEIGENVKSNLSYMTPTDRSYKLQNLISEQLCGAGFNEIMNNSQTRLAYYASLETWPQSHCVLLQNPISADLSCMRQTLLFGGLESIARNEKRKNSNLRLFEFGNCYDYNTAGEQNSANPLQSYSEDYRLGLWLCGNRVENSWIHPDEKSSVYELKAYALTVLERLGLNVRKLKMTKVANDIFSTGLVIASGDKAVCTLGIVRRDILKASDVDSEVYYAELLWTNLLEAVKKSKTTFSELSRFHHVKRDLALLIDERVSFSEIEKIAYESERRLLRDVVLFDVYEGKNLPEGKKSYAVSFYLMDEEKTLTDKQIDGIMTKIQNSLIEQAGAQLR